MQGSGRGREAAEAEEYMQQELSSLALTEQTNRLRARLSLLRHKKVQI